MCDFCTKSRIRNGHWLKLKIMEVSPKHRCDYQRPARSLRVLPETPSGGGYQKQLEVQIGNVLCFAFSIFHAWDMCICETLYIFRFSTMRPWECTITLPCIRPGSLPREEVNDDVIDVSAQGLWVLITECTEVGVQCTVLNRVYFISLLFLLHHPTKLSRTSAPHQSPKSDLGGKM